MKEATLGRIILFALGIFVTGAEAKEDGVPIFKVVSSRTWQEPPSIEVFFPNGLHDELVLEHYKLFKDSKEGYNYLGHLKSTPDSSVAVTGEIVKPTDRMEITLLSKHNEDQMYEVDYFGRTKVIPVPIENNEEKKRLVALARTEGKDEERDLDLEEGDEEVDEAKEKAVYSIGAIPMPSKLKMVVKIGYTEGLIWQMKNEAREEKREPETWESYIEKIMTHVQARYFDPTLGTLVQWEVQPGFLYTSNESWCAESGLWYAKQETIKAKLKDVDVTAWITTNNSTTCKHGGVVGMAYLTTLCGRSGVSINEKLSSYASTAYTVAHETGHNMGMSHDFSSSHGGDDNPCNKPKPIGTRGTMGYSFSATGWSQCSRYDFEHSYAEEFWGDGCLEDISSPCTKFTCENGGTCTETENGGFSCICPSGVTGTQCENNPNRHSNGKDNGCTKKNKCIEWDGDCDSDSDCAEGLICGTDNCPRKYGYDWDIGDDCCFKPEYYDDTNSTTCKTSKGTCIFPFYDQGVKFNNCVNPASYEKDGKEVGWCAFDRFYKSGRWDYCSDECLATHDGTCEATSLECRPIVSGSSRKGVGYNGTCTFPFKYDNRIYYTCADPKDYAGVGWCAFDFEMKGHRWGYCTSKCPKEVDKPCEGVVCNVPDEQCKNGVCTPGYDKACEGIVCNVANEKCVNGVCKCGDACSCEGNAQGSVCDAANSKCKCSDTEDACVGNKLCDPLDGKCKKCAGGDSCCKKDNKCGHMEGDCDNDQQCEKDLICGTNNCVLESIGDWSLGDDCCYNPNNMTCVGGDSCCTDKNPCGLGEGDCDRSSNCEEGLKCGTDNCKKCLGKDLGVDCSKFESGDDCCEPK